jgi:hypothetical protein
MLRAFGRIVLQLLLTGPVVFFYPFLLFATGHTVYDLFVRPSSIGPFSLMFVAGGLGLTGLYASILLPARWLAASKALRWTVTAFMGLGIVLAIVFLAIGGTPKGDPMEGIFWMAWTYGGPVIVAAWNLRRLWARPSGGQAPPGQ